jgi:hypothetical protein
MNDTMKNIKLILGNKGHQSFFESTSEAARIVTIASKVSENTTHDVEICDVNGHITMIVRTNE